MSERVLPGCLSIVLCDEVYRDEETKKLVLVGVFNTITASRLPYTHPRMHVLFTLTEAKGDFELSLSVERASDGHVVQELSGPVTSDSPLHVSDLNTEILELTFRDEGKYWLVVKADGQVLNMRPFWLKVVGEEGTRHANQNA